MRTVAALAIAGLLHLGVFTLLHLERGPAPEPKPAVEVVPYVEATDVQLAADEEPVVAAPIALPAPASASAGAKPVASGAAVAPASAGPAEPPTATDPEPAIGTGSATEAGSGSAAETGSGTASATGTGSGLATGSGSGTRSGSGATTATGPDRAALLGQILARVRAAKRYPEAARRRELEGVVRVRFVVGADGRPQGLGASDGDALLQRAAMDAVERAAPLPRVEGPIELDVEYRLSE